MYFLVKVGRHNTLNSIQNQTIIAFQYQTIMKNSSSDEYIVNIDNRYNAQDSDKVVENWHRQKRNIRDDSSNMKGL